MSFWLQTTDNAADVPLFGDRSTVGLGDFVDVSLALGRVTAEVDDGGTSTNDIQLISPGAVNDGAYHLITLVRQGNTLTLYIDAAEADSSSAAGTADITTPELLELGSEPLVDIENSPAYPKFVGQIDEAAIYGSCV